MKQKLMIFVLLIAAMIFMATAAFGQGKSRGYNRDRGRNNISLWEGGQDNGRHRYRGRNRITYGYRNYGQYRRTQVGNRRYRMVKRSYWRDGIRLSRLVRVYY